MEHSGAASSAFYQYDASSRYLRLKFQTSAGGGKAGTNKVSEIGPSKVLFVIDKSGSMSGSPFKQVQQVMDKLWKDSLVSSEDMSILTYSGSAQLIDIARLRETNASGGTSFKAAFEGIQQFVNKTPTQSAVSVVFMTDGEETMSTRAVMETVIKKFQTFLSQCGRVITIHCLGFGSSHDLQLLERLNKLGTVEGFYRFAGQAQDLDDTFTDMFAFASTTASIKVKINDHSYDLHGEVDRECRQTLYDTMIKLPASTGVDEQTINGAAAGQVLALALSNEAEPLSLAFHGTHDSDMIFQLMALDQEDVNDVETLKHLQMRLGKINPFKAPKGSDRQAIIDLRNAVQQKFDEYHALFADIARGIVNQMQLIAKKASIRHDVAFSKARRRRGMDKRATNNSHAVDKINTELEKIYTEAQAEADFDVFDTPAADVCALSGASIYEVMTESKQDIMVFGLQVIRSELVVDAPSSIELRGILVGTYSMEAFDAAISYNIQQRGTEAVYGGFVCDENSYVSLRSAMSGVDAANGPVGGFIGQDGRRPNAYLPLYINETHWRRVKAQLRPLLGMFFTMDPLGYDDSQIAALYTILGRLLMAKWTGILPKNDWNDRVIEELTLVCAALLPELEAWGKRVRMKSLNKDTSGAPSQLAGGSAVVCNAEVEGDDILEYFCANPHGRTLQLVSHLHMIVGIYYARKRDETVNMASDNKRQKTSIAELEGRLRIAFTEEVWRRGFRALNKMTSVAGGAGQQQTSEETLRALVFGSKLADFLAGELGAGSSELSAALDRAASVNNKNSESVHFSKWACYKLGLTKKAVDTPILSGLPAEVNEEDWDAASRASHSIRAPVVVEKVEGDREYLTKTMDGELAKIERWVETFACVPLYGGIEDVNMRRVMLLNAIQYSTGPAMSQAIATNTYYNLATIRNGTEVSIASASVAIRERLEKKLTEKYVSLVKETRARLTAMRIAKAKTMEEFAGRLLFSAPTRGGLVFELLVGILADGQIAGKEIPLLREKVMALFSGKVTFAEDSRSSGCYGFDDSSAPSYDVLAKGTTWTKCPSQLAHAFAKTVGVEVMVEIENRMRGTVVVHVYRESNIPNRHGHSNLNPFTGHAGGAFTGFGINWSLAEEQAQQQGYA